METMRRTMLFMPGNNPGMLQSAPILGADSVILDLEDAVGITEKDSARDLVVNAIGTLDFSQVEVVVRINSLETEFGHKDLEEITKAKPDMILIPKISVAQLKEAEEIVTKVEQGTDHQVKFFGIIETALAVETVYEITQVTNRLVGLLLGAEDLTADYGIERTKTGAEILYARNRVLSACKATGLMPIDTPFADFNDTDGLLEDTKLGKSLGFSGKAAINPRQVKYIHQIFNPTPSEIEYAQRVMAATDEAFAKELGVFSLDGQMIDAPIIDRAQTVLDIAKKVHLI